jgi:hypothetical protein
MAYTISYATPAVAFSVTKETAQEAFEMAMDYINQGYATVKLEDHDKGVTYGPHEIRKAWESGEELG